MNVFYLILFGNAVLTLYAFRTIHILTSKMLPRYKWGFRLAFLVTVVFIYATTSFLAVNRDDFRDSPLLRTYAIVGAVTLAVTLLSISIFQLLSDVTLFGRYLGYKATGKVKKGEAIPRRTFMNKVALGVGGIMLGAVLWGTTKGRFGWHVITNKLSFSNLPKAFDGVKIAQISDLHLGSFENNYEPLKEAVQMVNDLNPDYIFFTGDLVNEYPEEADSWIDIFAKLKAKSGKYAILGNHDYGWGNKGKLTEEDKTRNAAGVVEVFKKMDLKPLVNEHDILEKGGEKIGLVGVENWGYSKEGWFPMRGDYKKSVEGMEDVPFKILLSHDPTHWDHRILEKENVDLTLSGHTHGGQFGISIPGLVELSAGRFFYERYAGLYTEGKQHLYVNRGMGYLIFPGRVGMLPEITLHELSRA